MRTDTFKRYKTYIRNIREDLIKELNTVDNFNATKMCILMCRVWTCRGIIEGVYDNIHTAYFDNHSLTAREYRILEKYMDILSDYIWSEFYDKASDIDREVQTLNYKIRMMEG